LQYDIDRAFCAKFIEYWYVKKDQYVEITWRKDPSEDQRRKEKEDGEKYEGKKVWVPKKFMEDQKYKEWVDAFWPIHKMKAKK